MIVRVWKVGIADGQAEALEQFAKQVSLPMFRQQPGCLGVLFTRSEKTCATITLWESEESIEALNLSASYQKVVRAIEESGVLEGAHQTEAFCFYGGFLSSGMTQAAPEVLEKADG
jgi:heme-degrading monooxygenase HmoA